MKISKKKKKKKLFLSNYLIYLKKKYTYYLSHQRERTGGHPLPPGFKKIKLGLIKIRFNLSFLFNEKF
jgi:hypothetical protein